MGDVHNLKIAVSGFSEQAIFSLKRQLQGKDEKPAFIAADTSEACILDPKQAESAEVLFLETLVRECHKQDIPILPLKSNEYSARVQYEGLPKGFSIRFAEAAKEYFERTLHAGILFSNMLEPGQYNALLRPGAYEVISWQVAKLGLASDTLFDFDMDTPEKTTRQDSYVKDIFDFVSAIQNGEVPKRLGAHELDTEDFSAVARYLNKGLKKVRAVQQKDREEGLYRLINV